MEKSSAKVLEQVITTVCHVNKYCYDLMCEISFVCVEHYDSICFIVFPYAFGSDACSTVATLPVLTELAGSLYSGHEVLQADVQYRNTGFLELEYCYCYPGNKAIRTRKEMLQLLPDGDSVLKNNPIIRYIVSSSNFAANESLTFR
ncbi:hypothetical protein HAX54_048923 [Datura stramonium]|uniref:Uncharacterized protein n=1 Tax=Datura stramonium TaxID=4076 RepID=A0ABS8WMR7_DATST|nr:hypothetical protein [Datura stramonium]